MAYSTLDDLKKHIPEKNLIELTDDEDTGSINQARVDEAIEYADQLIDGYLRGRYQLPLNPVPMLIQKLSVDLAIFYLYQRRFELDMPEGMADRYENTIRILERIQGGKITLGDQSGNTPEPGEYRTNKSEDDRVFNRDLWEKY